MFDGTDAGRVRGSFFGTAASIPGAERLTCGDLFAGAGGFSLAAMNLGMDVRFAIENDKHACDTYETNLITGSRPFLCNSDISKLSPAAIQKDCFSEEEHCDLILGGPPCQGFSVHRLNDAGKGDPRNNLIYQYFRFVSHFRPKAFIMENVPGMLWPRHADYLERFYSEAADKGYQVREPILVEAADFGVPQKRKRVFVLGVRDDVTLDFKWPISGGFVRKLKKEGTGALWRTASEVFATPLAVDDVNAVHMNHTDELIEVFRSTPINGGSRHDSKRTLPCHEGHSGHKDVYGRIDPEKPGPTMTTACINPSKGRFVHPTEHHGITVRHAARLQTFPDDFTFRGGLMAAGSQIGNAVPVLLGEAVLGAIAEALIASNIPN